MAETLVELVARISVDASELKKALAESEKDVEGLGKTVDKETKSISDAWKSVGKSFVIVGASITAAMGLVIKSFTSTGSELHDLSLKTGVSVKALAGLKYAAEQNGATLGTVEMAIKRVALAMTGVTGETGNAKEAFDRIGLSLTDLQGLNPEEQFLKIAFAIAAIPDPMTRAATAVALFGRSGTDMLPMLSKGTEGLRKMMEEGVKLTSWTTEAAKLADDFADSLGTLKTAVSGVFVAIGSNLVPKLQELVNSITQTIGKMTEWAKEHPELTRGLGLLTLGLGGALTVIGGLIVAIPKLTAAWEALSLAFTASPLGLIVVGLTAIGLATIGVANAMDTARQKTRDAATEYYAYWDAEVKAGRATLELVNGLSKYTVATSAAAIATNKAKQELVNTAPAIEAIKKKIEDLKTEYGDLGNAIKSKGDMARAASQVAKDALSSELDKARESTDKQLGFLSKLYAEKIRLVNAGADIAIKGIQGQIDAINKQTELENQALEDKRDKDQLSKLSGKERTDFLAEMARKLVLRQRELDKDALRDSIEKVREDTKNKVDNLNKELEAAQQTERDRLTATEERIKQSNRALDIALDKELARLASELAVAEGMELAKLAKLDETLALEELKIKESWERKLEEAKKYYASLYGLMGGGVLPAGQTSMPIPPGGLFTTPGGNIVGPGERYLENGTYGVAPMASGGIVTQPTLGMVGEAGPEAVIPLNEMGSMGGVTINFTQPVFFDREDTMNRFVDMISKGIDRKQRLRFGGAYSGG